MSTSPDDLVQILSRWLAGRADVEQVQAALSDPDQLGPASAELVDELRDEFAKPDVRPATLQPLVRETIEAIAHGD